MKMEEVFEITDKFNITYKMSLCDICSETEDENSTDCEECTRKSINYDVNKLKQILEKEILRKEIELKEFKDILKKLK